MRYGADVVQLLFTSVPNAIFFFVSVCFPPLWLVLLFFLLVTHKHSVTKTGFLLPGTLYSIGSVRIFRIEPLSQIWFLNR